jgi:hypothetical protein
MNKSSMAPEVWKNWQDFRTATWGKKVVFFGVSQDWSTKTISQCDISLEAFVDNNPSFVGTLFHDVEVKSPEVLKEKGADVYVVITSGAYESIYPQLIEYGLKPGIDFCITPALNNLRAITEIHMHEADILISSPDHKIYTELDKGTDIGGGLYVYSLQKRTCKKVLAGVFHQIVDTGQEYYVANEQSGISKISKQFELMETFGLEEGARCHGIAYCPKRNIVCLGCTSLDKVTAYDAATHKLVFTIELTGKIKHSGKAEHWLNDLCIRDNYLYITMFSLSGSHLNGIYDGGIMQVDLEDLSKRYVLMHDLWMPHTVRFFDDQICFLDSMNGYFYRTTKNIIGEFDGFMRGLAFDGKYYYVGQSETRYFDRLKGIKKHIAMSAGFYLFDDETKAAKFFCTPNIRQVHDLCYIT